MELTIDQQQDLSKGEPVAVNIGGKDCVLLTRQAYEQFKSCQYDDSPWTKEETDLLAAETAELLAGDAFDRGDAHEHPQCRMSSGSFRGRCWSH